jgi:hypothetical protein
MNITINAIVSAKRIEKVLNPYPYLYVKKTTQTASCPEKGYGSGLRGFS